jgi:pimeloyl-ACP methyl ester carboxylesterase
MELREARVDGRTARWRVSGAGPPLVLVHGLSGSWRWWSGVLEPLAAVRELHLVDVSSAPASASAWLLRWADAAELGRFGLIGHSLGGAVAARVAAAAPERVTELVLVSAVGMPSGRPLLGYGLPLVEALRTATPSFLRTLALDALRTGAPRLLAGALYATRADVRAEASRIRAPTLLVWGDHDPLVPAALAADWRRALPQARLVTIPGAGHVPMIERPAEFASAVRGFLDEAGDGAGGAPVRRVRRAGDDGDPAAG